MSDINPIPRILLLSGYDAASHIYWRNRLLQNMPMYDWHVLALPPRHFRWRIRGNALSWLNHPYMQQPWDLLLVTSMVDLASLKGFHPKLAAIPSVLYVHENQFAFPLNTRQQSGAEPQMVNLYSALSADRILFNSHWNKDSFLQGMTAFLKKMPDQVPPDISAAINPKSHVIPVPISNTLFRPPRHNYNWACPHLLWNHRWEYDKAPERLLAFLKVLARHQSRFTLSVVGERFRKWPNAFAEIQKRFANHIVNWGYIPNRQHYNQLLQQADVVLSTALHDFQGLAMLEAIASGCIPLAPNRLAYPEYIDPNNLYQSHEDNLQLEAEAAVAKLSTVLHSQQPHSVPVKWSENALIPQYQQIFNQLI